MNTHTHTCTRARKSGFSLLELLAVMSIIAVLSTLAVTSYFNAIRGMASRSAARNFEDSLKSARQRACLGGSSVSLMVFNEVGAYDSDRGEDVLIPSFVICKQIGRISFISETYLFDEFSDLKYFGVRTDSNDDDLGGFRLYNLSQGKWSLVKSGVVYKPEGSPIKLMGPSTTPTVTLKAYAFEVITDQSEATWRVGDAYGVEVAPMQSLPKGHAFADLQGKDDVWYVTFKPDGSTIKSSSSITIKEMSTGGQEIEGGVSTTFEIDNNGKLAISKN